MASWTDIRSVILNFYAMDSLILVRRIVLKAEENMSSLQINPCRRSLIVAGMIAGGAPIEKVEPSQHGRWE